MSGPSFAAIDFEIATASWSTACAVGVVLVDDGAVTGEHRYLIRPPDNLYGEFHVALHGITPEDTAGAPGFPEVWSRVADLIGERIVVAHNAAFDFGVVRRSAAHWGYTCPELSFTCTYRLAQRAWPNRRTYRLDALTTALGVALDHHDPLSDARAAAHVALRLCAHCGLSSLADLAEHVHYPLGRLLTTEPLTPSGHAATARAEYDAIIAEVVTIEKGWLEITFDVNSDKAISGKPVTEQSVRSAINHAAKRAGIVRLDLRSIQRGEEIAVYCRIDPAFPAINPKVAASPTFAPPDALPPRPPPSLPISAERYHAPIEILDLSVRAYNCLRRSGLMTVGQVLERTEEELLKLRNFGRKAYDEMRDRLIERRYIDGEADGLVIIPDYANPLFPPILDNVDEDGEEDGEGMSALGKALRDAGDDDLLGADDEEEMGALDMSALIKKALREAHQSGAPIEALDLSPRACNLLRRSGLTTVGQVLERTSEELLAIRNFGPKSYAELHGRLREYGYIDGSAP